MTPMGAASVRWWSALSDDVPSGEKAWLVHTGLVAVFADGSEPVAAWDGTTHRRVPVPEVEVANNVVTTTLFLRSSRSVTEVRGGSVQGPTS